MSAGSCAGRGLRCAAGAGAGIGLVRGRRRGGSGEGADRDRARRLPGGVAVVRGVRPATACARDRRAAAPMAARSRRVTGGGPAPRPPAPRGRPCAARGGAPVTARGGGRRVGREQLRVEPLQLGPGIHAELVRDDLPAPGRTPPAPRRAARRPQAPASAAATAARAAGAPPPACAAPVSPARPGRRPGPPRRAARSRRARAPPPVRPAVVISGDGGTSASSGPRHSPSASPSSAAARSGSPAASALLPSATSDSNSLQVQVARGRGAAGTRAPGRRAPCPRCRRSAASAGARRC